MNGVKTKHENSTLIAANLGVTPSYVRMVLGGSRNTKSLKAKQVLAAAKILEAKKTEAIEEIKKQAGEI